MLTVFIIMMDVGLVTKCVVRNLSRLYKSLVSLYKTF